MSRLPHSLTALLDSAAIVGAIACACWLTDTATWEGAAIAASIHVPLWLAIASRVGAYRVGADQCLRHALGRMTEAWAATWGVGGLLSLTFAVHIAPSVWWTLLAGLVGLTLVRVALATGPLGSGSQRSRAIIIGSCPSARAVSDSRATAQMDVIGLVPFTHEDPSAIPHLRPLGQVASLPELVPSHRIDVAIVSPSDAAVMGEIRHAVQTCNDLGVAVRYFPSFLDVDHLRVNLTWDADRPGLDVRTATAPTLALAAKRVIDIAGAVIGLVASLPVLVLSAVVIKLTSRGPVFFKQERVGMGGRRFTCLKFRTMRVGAHAQQELLRSASTQDGPAFKVPADPRVTPFGRLLRKFSIDELPQLLNVLAGDMSLVGPRPPIPSEVEKYAWWQRRRISVRPGLTCLWQVYGRNTVTFKRWVEMDLYYIDNWSLWLDLKLIAHTFRAVLRGTGM